ncbi:MAG: hypothetical protein GC190_03760 [Alphaproteobacteria bacterium]|nr:hypothetical protein [Alphaproteobacteria bacterium]
MNAAMDTYLIVHATAAATALLIGAFLILAVAERSLGFANIFGKLLAFWLALIAFAAVAGAVTAPQFGGKPFGLDLPFYQAPAQPVAPPAESSPQLPPSFTPGPWGG